MKKNEHRKMAEKAFLTDRGRITNKDLAERLGVHPATVARWKKIDEWDLKLVRSVTVADSDQEAGDDYFVADLRHIGLINERIEAYLKKKELLPSEILELAEAKFNLMSCMAMIDDRTRFPHTGDLESLEDDFD